MSSVAAVQFQLRTFLLASNFSPIILVPCTIMLRAACHFNQGRCGNKVNCITMATATQLFCRFNEVTTLLDITDSHNDSIYLPLSRCTGLVACFQLFRSKKRKICPPSRNPTMTSSHFWALNHLCIISPVLPDAENDCRLFEPCSATKTQARCSPGAHGRPLDRATTGHCDFHVDI